MAIYIDRNAQYGGSLVTSKYSPLLNIVYESTPADRKVYSDLLTSRSSRLRNEHLLGGRLSLLVPNWAAASRDAGTKPPLVVISSNRSKWIKQGLDAAADRLKELRLDAFDNASDLRAIVDPSASKRPVPPPIYPVSPPIYAPKRIGSGRRVYVVVHASEYQMYAKVLAGTGITVVGWAFPRPAPEPRLMLMGFGASRFAAIEFCKELRRAATPARSEAPWNQAWLLDDNVVAMSPFAGFTKFEAALEPRDVCAGFHGGTTTFPRSKSSAWAAAEIVARRGVETLAVPTNNPPGIVQQASLWNIKYLADNHLNFSPLFITSGEDLSFVNYFEAKKIGYRYYTGTGVLKETPTPDGGVAAGRVSAARERLAKWMTDGEKVAPLIRPAQRDDGGDQPLSTFVVDRVLPKSSALKAQAGSESVQCTARSHAVEQICCGAIEHYVNRDVLDATFMTNTADRRTIVRANVAVR